MNTFATHPDAFRLPRSSAPDVQISAPDAHIDAVFAMLAQSQGFQHYGRPEVEDLTRLFKALIELHADESLQTRACEYAVVTSHPQPSEPRFPVNALYKNNDRGQSFGTALMAASDETVNKICTCSGQYLCGIRY